MSTKRRKISDREVAKETTRTDNDDDDGEKDVREEEESGRSLANLVSELLSSGPESLRKHYTEHPDELRRPLGRWSTPLEAFTSTHRWSAIETLLDCGADPNVETAQGKTLVWELLIRGMLPVARALRSRGARLVEKLSDSGFDFHAFFLQVVFPKDPVETFRWLRDETRSERRAGDKETQNGIPLLHRSVFLGGVGVLSSLVIEEKVDVNLRDDIGSTPLHLAMHVGSFDAVAFLLEHGADPLAYDDDGKLPTSEKTECRELHRAQLFERRLAMRRKEMAESLSAPQSIVPLLTDST